LGNPVKISVLERMAQNLINSGLDISVMGRDGTEKKYRIDAKFTDKVFAFINSISYGDLTDGKILAIILEEATDYFGDGKAPEDVAAIIQSRVSLYLQENR